MNLKFEESKLKLELKRSGTDFIFKRQTRDVFGKIQGESEEINVRGLYHEENSYIEIKTSDGTRFQKKKVPMILCLFSECGVKLDDVLEYNDCKFKVTGVKNIQEWNVVADISLEVVQ